MPIDKFTQLRQMGYYGTEAEMLVKYIQDITGLDTIGEQLDKALDAAMARQVIGVTGSGGGLVQVPADLQATGVPDNTKFLRGDGAWAIPAGGGGGGGVGTDPNSVQLTGDQTINGIKTFVSPPVGVTKAAVGLGNVDNTSDINKPVSTASDNKYATKVNVVHTGTTSFDAGSIAQAAVATLVTDLANKIGVIASTADVTVQLLYRFTTSNPGAVRPSIPASASAEWNLPGSTPPANATGNDTWLR